MSETARELAGWKLEYQPIVDLESGEVSSVEALLRAGGNTSELTEKAERGTEIFRLDREILETACIEAVSWQQAGLGDIGVHVNLSAREFDGEQVLTMIDEALASSGLDASSLNVEITETSRIQDMDLAQRILESLERRRVKVWLDDFGTGHSSLEWLKDFRVTGVKLPLPLIHDVVHQPRSAAIVSAVIALVHELDMRVIAEGVENGDQVAFLRAHGCDAMQGWFLAPAVPAAELRAEIGRRRKPR